MLVAFNGDLPLNSVAIEGPDNGIGIMMPQSHYTGASGASNFRIRPEKHT
ncbi:MAG: hypothetical protein AB1560_12795 [Pseudomonadota bacterium]